MEAIIEKSQLQTIAWTHNVANKTGSDPTSPSDLGIKTGIRKQYWSRYLNWGFTGNREKSNPPNEVIRSLLEVGDPKENIIAIEGSKNVYDIGPEKAPLWAALWPENKQELWNAANTISKKVQIHKVVTELKSGTQCGCDYTKLELDTADIYIEALIEYANESLVFSSITDGNVDIHDLTALIAAYRLCPFYFPDKGEHLKSIRYCIKTLLCNQNIIHILSIHGVLNVVTKILFEIIPGLYQREKLTTSPRIIFDDNSASEITKHLTTRKIIKDDLSFYLLGKIRKAWIKQATLDDIGKGADLSHLITNFTKNTFIGDKELSTEKDAENLVEKFLDAVDFAEATFQKIKVANCSSKIIDLSILEEPPIHEEILTFNEKRRLAANF